MTANPSENGVISYDISPDGRHILYGDGTGYFYREIDSGQTRPLHLPDGFAVWGIAGWSPDPTAIYLYASESPEARPALWSFSLLERTPRRAGDSVAFALGMFQGTSPDGSGFCSAGL
jgi:hypothetical protein